MIIGSFNAYSGWLAWVGLANWLPFFWCFWAFQPYLMTAKSRRRSAFCLLVGTLPVLVTGLGQMFLDWHGPWQLFNGLIVWFVDQGGQPSGRLSGLFSYANLAGAWLAMIWPFALAALLQPCLNRYQRSLVFLFSILISFSLILTDSRNAWGGLILAVPFVLGPYQWVWLFPLCILALAPVVFSIIPWINIELQSWARQIVPETIWGRLNDMKYVDRPFSATRLSQWIEAINLSLARPILGWGAAAFSILYPLRKGIWHGHAHNLPLEIAVSHGLPVAALIVGAVILLLITSLRRGVLTRRAITAKQIGLLVCDRAWWTACFVLICLHGADMPFFDSRLNIAGWILLAGLRCLIISLNSGQFENLHSLKIALDVE